MHCNIRQSALKIKFQTITLRWEVENKKKASDNGGNASFYVKGDGTRQQLLQSTMALIHNSTLFIMHSVSPSVI